MSKLSENKTFMFLLRACVALLLICLVFNLCVIPSFAFTTPSNEFVLMPAIDGLSVGGETAAQLVIDNGLGLVWWYTTDYSNTQTRVTLTYADADWTSFCFYDGTNYDFYNVFDINSGVTISRSSYLRPHYGDLGNFSVNPTSGFATNTDLGIIYNNCYRRQDYTEIYVPIYTSLDDGLAAAAEFLESSGQPIITEGGSIVEILDDNNPTSIYTYNNNSRVLYKSDDTTSKLGACYFYDGTDVFYRVCSINPVSYYSLFNGTLSTHNMVNSANGFSYSNVMISDAYDTLNENIITFQSQAEFETSMLEFLNSNVPPSSGDLVTSSSYFGVPSGYAAFIELPQNSSDWNVQVTQEFDEYSSLFGGQWDVMTSLWGFQSSLPSGNGNFSKTGLTVIPMYKQKPFTVLGQSKTGFSNKATMIANGFWSDTPSNTYLVIYNPVIRSVSGSVGGASNANNVYHYNKGISVTMEGFYSPVKYYKLESTVTTSGVESAPSNGTFEDSESTETFNTDGTSNGVVDSSGNNVNLQDGGGDLIPSATSIGDYLRNLNATVSDFANNFVELLSAPISHVRQLISAGTEYFGVIRGLYAWLPSSVQSTIESALIVSISIGVIGLLL